MSRQGGKLKPLKAPKKEHKDEDEDDKAFKEKKKAEEAALKAARDKAVKGEFPKHLISVSITHDFNKVVLLVAESRNRERNRRTMSSLQLTGYNNH
ncbi:hypothetical protein P692DRAFT_20951662 [Suillus brevipes Sb2]|nr:hypothetical protein P692DRAFT_20951662 [Suillus brevipes Sb2]